MIPQGFPLHATDEYGSTYAVVGWTEDGRPYLVPLQGYTNGPQLPMKGQPFQFTTTDPTTVKPCPCRGDCETGGQAYDDYASFCQNGTHISRSGNSGWACEFAGRNGCAA